LLNLDAARRPDPTDCPPSQAMRSLPSHQQRKVAKRAKFLDKIRVASLSATKRSPSAKKRKSAKGLSASSLDFATLSATLGEVGVDTAVLKSGRAKRKNGPGTLKRQQRLVASESDRLRAVLAHPAFRADPAAAVTNHVVAALAASAAAKKSRLGSNPEGDKRSTVGKKKKSASKDGGEVSAGASRAAREASDAVASSAARRSEAASARGITLRGGDDRRGPKDKLGVVHHASKAKKGAGGKKGSKRSKKRARETW
jgi:hypothetical protein